MLAIGRKANQSFSVRCPDGQFITVRIICFTNNGTQARIGIDAPANYEIHRGEVWAQVGQERGLELPRSVTT